MLSVENDFIKVREIVKHFFIVREEIIIAYDKYAFFVSKLDGNINEQFMKLYKILIKKNYIPMLIESGDNFIIRIIKLPEQKSPQKSKNYILLFLTVITITVAGYRFVFNDLFFQFFPYANPILTIIAYTVALFGIISIHELGHLLAAKRYNIRASLPYFIPDPFAVMPMLPTIGGTFGAIISQKTPPPNKNALFDLGFSGPIFGFIIAIIVTIIGLNLSVEVPTTTPGEIIPSPVLFDILVILILRPSPNMDVLLHPIAYAGWVGFLITGLNLLPAGQLDGGHIARALFGKEGHKKMTYISIIILIILLYIPMALLVWFLSRGKEHPGPLEDISDVSLIRKIGGIIALLITILSLPPVILYIF